MIIGKIPIDLDYLQYHLTTEYLKIVHKYLDGNKEINMIRQLIEIISRSELTLFTDEEFLPYYVYEDCEYNQVSEMQLQ